MLLPIAVPISGVSVSVAYSAASSSLSDGYFLDRRFVSFLNLSEGMTLKLIEERGKRGLGCFAAAHLVCMREGFLQVALQREGLLVASEFGHERFPIGERKLNGVRCAGAVGDVLDGDVHGLNLRSGSRAGETQVLSRAG